MSVFDNSRHERFAQFLAQGKTATEAYKLAGYKPNRHNAATLARNDAVKERVAQITTKAGVAVAITLETLMQKAEAICERAYESGQYGVATGALKEMGVLSGVRVERSEIGGPGEFDHLTDEELERELVERIRALGLIPDAG
jgi:hypothetical protein